MFLQIVLLIRGKSGTEEYLFLPDIFKLSDQTVINRIPAAHLTEGFFQQTQPLAKPVMTKKEQAILDKIREIARTPEEYEKLVEKYLKPGQTEG